MPAIDSTCVSFADYDEETKDLTIVFKRNGEQRVYSNFPKYKWREFLASSSKGQYFNQEIRDVYE